MTSQFSEQLVKAMLGLPAPQTTIRISWLQEQHFQSWEHRRHRIDSTAHRHEQRHEQRQGRHRTAKSKVVLIKVHCSHARVHHRVHPRYVHPIVHRRAHPARTYSKVGAGWDRLKSAKGHERRYYTFRTETLIILLIPVHAPLTEPVVFINVAFRRPCGSIQNSIINNIINVHLPHRGVPGYTTPLCTCLASVGPNRKDPSGDPSTCEGMSVHPRPPASGLCSPRPPASRLCSRRPPRSNSL